MKKRSVSVSTIALLVVGLGYAGVKHFAPNFDSLAGSSTTQIGEAVAQTSKGVINKPVVLALSWTAAFCETKPNKRECKSQTKKRYDAANFALHGLWPEPQFCSRVRYQNVPDKLWKAMRIAMPGTQSGLHKHEWEKHGTCYSDGPTRYYADAIRLTIAFNKTPLQDLFADNIGKHLSAREIRAAFDEAFGRGAGDRVLVHCVRDGGRQLIQELRIAMRGDLRTTNFPVLLSKPVPKSRGVVVALLMRLVCNRLIICATTKRASLLSLLMLR